MTIASNIILQESKNGISRIKLNDPTNYNALSSNNLRLLIKGFKRLSDDNKTKVIMEIQINCKFLSFFIIINVLICKFYATK
jgi:enoyl-CoA hydratase/carnithine racemase